MTNIASSFFTSHSFQYSLLAVKARFRSSLIHSLNVAAIQDIIESACCCII